MSKPLAITDVVLRDAHQSCLLRVCVLKICCRLQLSWTKVGYWSLKLGAEQRLTLVFVLGEDPWERLRELKKAMPNTQCKCFAWSKLLGYRHYADDVEIC